MSDSSRRGFLKVAGAGVAGAAAVAAGAATVAQSAGATGAAPVPASGEREILAHVHDVRTGRISLMVEGHEVTVTDPDLAARIATAQHRSAAAPTSV